jgi:hypothetical protein
MEKKELQKASTELSSRYLGKELVDRLSEPTPEDIIDERPVRGGGMVKYVAGSHFVRKLNECFGYLWSYEVPQTFELNGQIVARGRLTVHIPVPKKTTIRKYIEDGKEVEEKTIEYEMHNIVKEQFGSSEIKRYATDVRGKKGEVTHRAGDVIDLGDDYKGAGTDAMKKCATQLGVFLDVYEAREKVEEGVVTKEQLDVFYWRAEEAGMTREEAEKWGEEQIGKPMKEWDPLDAMGLIPKLIDLKEKKEG